jgi:DNA repair exonuclease SbcCD nuclease subunit
MKFLHTADWQLGKPYEQVADSQKRALLQTERINAVRRLGKVVAEHRAAFVVVAGDLFDSPNADQATVSAACSAIGSLKVPVFVIPGNHDHGGPGSVWDQEFFGREQQSLAVNLKLIRKAEPIEIPEAMLYPCPLLRRHEAQDPTLWLRAFPEPAASAAEKPRIIIAHGSVLNFTADANDEEDSEAGVANFLDLSRIAEASYDYAALGDWHGTKQVGNKAWYSGTPEIDRFVKGGDHNPGNVLLVDAGRLRNPKVEMIRTAAFGWHEVKFDFPDDASLEQLRRLVEAQIDNRAQQDLLKLELSGSLGFEAFAGLEKLLETWAARLLRLKLDTRTIVAPTPSELESLKLRVQDPLIARVASKLEERARGIDETAAVARIALRELYVFLHFKPTN